MLSGWKLFRKVNISRNINIAMTNCPVKCRNVDKTHVDKWDISKQVEVQKRFRTNDTKTKKNIVIGYKINNPEYFIIKEIQALVDFSIYKTYFIRESRGKKVDSFNFFCDEYKETYTFS